MSDSPYPRTDRPDTAARMARERIDKFGQKLAIASFKGAPANVDDLHARYITFMGDALNATDHTDLISHYERDDARRGNAAMRTGGIFYSAARDLHPDGVTVMGTPVQLPSGRPTGTLAFDQRITDVLTRYLDPNADRSKMTRAEKQEVMYAAKTSLHEHGHLTSALSPAAMAADFNGFSGTVPAHHTVIEGVNEAVTARLYDGAMKAVGLPGLASSHEIQAPPSNYEMQVGFMETIAERAGAALGMTSGAALASMKRSGNGVSAVHTMLREIATRQGCSPEVGDQVVEVFDGHAAALHNDWKGLGREQRWAARGYGRQEAGKAVEAISQVIAGRGVQQRAQARQAQVVEERVAEL